MVQEPKYRSCLTASMRRYKDPAARHHSDADQEGRHQRRAQDVPEDRRLSAGEDQTGPKPLEGTGQD